MYRGRYNGAPLGVVSHGVGASGATICFEELCQAGVRRIIRAGTAGGLQERVRDGDVVVVSGAVRDDGVTPRIVPLSYPAVPSLDVVADLRSASSNRGVETHEGIVLTSDLFYPHPVLGSDLLLWQRAGVIAVEMECAALFVVSSQYDVESGAILAIDGNPLAQGNEDMTRYDPQRDVVSQAVDAVIRVALNALAPSFA
jgi:uridine phosphorylase